MTPAQRAAAETRQRTWARKVQSLRGEEYGPQTADQADCETLDSVDDSVGLTEAQLARQTADRALTIEKEQVNRTKIMEKYMTTLESLPDASLVIYTDGGWTKPGKHQAEECGWGYSVRIRYREYPQQQVDDGVYQAIHVGEDWGSGWQVEVHRRWGAITTDQLDADKYVGALHLINNTAELTAAIQVMLYFASLHEHVNTDAAVPPPPHKVLIVADSTYAINAATRRQLPYGRESPNVAIITVLREAYQWVIDSGTTISW
jgi:hypothetical protein